MKDSDIINVQEPRLSATDQFFIPQVLKGLGTTMKHMLKVLGGTDRVVQYPPKNAAKTSPSKKAACSSKPIAGCTASTKTKTAAPNA